MTPWGQESIILFCYVYLADIRHFGKLSVPRLTNFRMAHNPDDLLRGQVQDPLL